MNRPATAGQPTSKVGDHSLPVPSVLVLDKLGVLKYQGPYIDPKLVGL